MCRWRRSRRPRSPRCSMPPGWPWSTTPRPTRRESPGGSGTCGTFTYDSVKLLAEAVTEAGGWNEAAVQSRLDHIVNYKGITGAITIEPKTGNRADSPVVILDIDSSGNYLINRAWAQAARF